MAISTLKAQAQSNPEYRHQSYHDLESFYWLLIDMALRHTRHSQPPLTSGDLFDSKVAVEAAERKRKWLVEFSLEIQDNEPFTNILRRWSELVKIQVMTTPQLPVLTHQAVLDILNHELSSPKWPKDDEALPFLLLSKKNGGMPSQAQKKKLTRMEASNSNPSESNRYNSGFQSGVNVSSLESAFRRMALPSGSFSKHPSLVPLPAGSRPAPVNDHSDIDSGSMHILGRIDEI